ncbi:hypothetical protein WH50_15610 [Pokkaliibacter plantistimulans]|uniref:Nitrate/nitrite sensing protein domain-containing protein n=1 Tax=Pokkaliibacter plantistimulans TaxID=1635171 RepID=A0ABX5LY26_9GAMM|nr:hypothetical protein [Pokkaliibacter plantistimulans]PXF30363.1 hypothetical protein WH50_15610 [Pokkaliibacter plantistimulans]
MPVWLKTIVLITLAVCAVAFVLLWWLRHRRQMQARQATLRFYLKYHPLLVDALDALHDCTVDRRVIEPYRQALQRLTQALRQYGQLTDAMEREAVDVINMEVLEKDEWLLLAKHSLREVEFYSQRFQLGLKALIAVSGQVGASREELIPLKRSLIQLTSKMRVCTLMQVATHLEHEGKLDQALNCFHQAQRELSRWRNPDAMLREQSRRVMEALQRLRDVVDQSNPLLQALQKEEQGDGLPQAAPYDL